MRDLFLLTMKPLMYVANVAEDGFDDNPLLDTVRAARRGRGRGSRAGVRGDRGGDAELEDADRDVFLADLGLDEPGLNRVIRAGYKLLGLQTYFTAGEKEVRAWTVSAARPRRRRPA